MGHLEPPDGTISRDRIRRRADGPSPSSGVAQRADPRRAHLMPQRRRAGRPRSRRGSLAQPAMASTVVTVPPSQRPTIAASPLIIASGKEVQTARDRSRGSAERRRRATSASDDPTGTDDRSTGARSRRRRAHGVMNRAAGARPDRCGTPRSPCPATTAAKSHRPPGGPTLGRRVPDRPHCRADGGRAGRY